MFERFTEEARQVVVLAQEEARTSGHDHVGTEHLLLGLLRLDDPTISGVFEGLGVDLAAVREKVPRDGERRTTGQIPFAPEAKKALELALREALSLGNNYIGPQHVLLGVARDENATAMQILGELGVDGERVRDEVLGVVPTPVPGPWARIRRRRRWDYLVVELGALASADDLQGHGADGWELVAVVGEPGAYRGVFKRPA